jgi:hypothetical protein
MRRVYAYRDGRMVEITNPKPRPLNSSSAICSKRPWRSMGMAPSQASQVEEYNSKAVHGRYFVENGQTFYEADSRAGRAAEMRNRGMFDKDAGYGDHSGS